MTVPLTPPDYQALKTNTVSVTVKPVPTDAEADNDTDPLVLADMIETYAHTPFHTILPSPPPPTPATTQSMVARAHILAFICDEVTRIPHEESFLSFTPSTAGAGRSPRTVEVCIPKVFSVGYELRACGLRALIGLQPASCVLHPVSFVLHPTSLGEVVLSPFLVFLEVGV
jgi:hypothetical protein